MHRNQVLMIDAKVCAKWAQAGVDNQTLRGLAWPILQPEVALTNSVLTPPLHGGATARSDIRVVGSSVSCRSIMRIGLLRHLIQHPWADVDGILSHFTCS